MHDRILEIVVFLMDYMRDNQVRLSESDDFSMTLKTMGYSDNEISSAYYWLMTRFQDTPERLFSEFPEIHNSTRILTASERMMLTTEAHAFILKLWNHSLIDSQQFESIMDRLSLFGTDPVSSEQIKLVASSVVFNEVDDLFEDPDSLFDSQTRLVN